MHRLAAFTLLCALLAPILRAQTSINLAPGNNFTSFNTTVDNPHSFLVLVGPSYLLGTITGDGSITKQGPGELTLTGDNFYTGGTTVNQGALRLTTAHAAGTGDITLEVGGSLHLFIDGTFSNSISGPGDVHIYQNTTLTGANTHSNYTRLHSGRLSLGPGAAGNSHIQFLGGTLVLTDATDLSANIASTQNQQIYIDTNWQTVTFANPIIGVGSTLHVFGEGTLILAAGAGHTGLTTLSSGALHIGNGGSTGELSGDVFLGNSDLVFNRTGTYSHAHAIENHGNVWVTGGGTLQLSGPVSGPGYLHVESGNTLELIGETSITNDLYVEGSLVANYGNHTISGAVVAGAGTLTKFGHGTLTLTNDNVIYGGTTVLEGTIQLGDGTTTGTIVGPINVAGGATFALNPAGTLIFNRIVDGEGVLEKRGSGTVIVTNWQGHSGGTSVTGGILQVNDGGTLPSPISVGPGAKLTYALTGDLNFGGVISGLGMFRKEGAGKFTFTTDQNYTGLTEIAAGSLQVGNGTSGSIASSHVNISSGATLTFNRSDDLTFAGLFSGGGSLVKSGSGTLTLTGDSTYSGSVTVSAGTLQLGHGGSTGWLGDRNVSIAPGATFAINRSNDFTYAGALSGSGHFSKDGTGTLTLSGTNIHTGGTTIAAGTLRIGASIGFDANFNNVYGGSLAGNITNHGALIFERGDNITFAGSISGSGSVTQAGIGNLVLTGSNNYTGDTILSSGTLELGSANALGSGGTIFLQGGTLRYSNASTTDYSSRFSVPEYASIDIDTNGQNVTFASGFGAPGAYFNKNGPGTLTLSGANTLDGIAVNGGTLVAGSTAALGGASSAYVGGDAVLDVSASGLTIANSGSLYGSGTVVGAVTLGNGGTLLAFDSDQPLVITGGLNLLEGAMLQLQARASAPLLVTGGLISSAGLDAITLDIFGIDAPATFTLIDFTGADYSGLSANHFRLGYIDAYDWNLNQPLALNYSLALVGSTLTLTASAIPEPSTYALLAGLAALALVFRHRRSA